MAEKKKNNLKAKTTPRTLIPSWFVPLFSHCGKQRCIHKGFRIQKMQTKILVVTFSLPPKNWKISPWKNIVVASNEVSVWKWPLLIGDGVSFRGLYMTSAGKGWGLLAAYPTKSRLPASHNHRRCQWPRACALMGFRRQEDPPVARSLYLDQL